MAKPRNSNKDHKNLTFRLDSSVMEAVRRDSEENGFSLNSLANRQFQQYTEWDRIEGKIGFTTVRHRVLRAMLSRIPDEEIAAMGRAAGPAEAREYILLRWRTLSMETFVSFVENYARFATQFNLTHHPEDGHLMILSHSLGEKWSIYLESFMSTALQDLFGVEITSHRTDEAVSLSFRLPDDPG